MKICIYGAGVIGGLIASAHARAGHAVSVIARGPQLAAIQARGLTIVTPEGGSVTTRPAASADPHDFGTQDLVIVATKTPAFADVAAHIGPLLGPDTLVGFAVNGIFWFYGDGFSPHGMKIEVPRLDPDGALHRLIGPARALGYVCWMGGEIRAPGTIHANRDGGRIEAASRRMEEAARRLQNLFARRPPNRRKIRGDDSGFGRMARLERLRHGAEVFPQTSRLAGGNAERTPRALHIKTT